MVWTAVDFNKALVVRMREVMLSPCCV